MKWQKTFGIVALLLMAIIFIDHYVLPKQAVGDVIDDMYHYWKAKVHRYYIVTGSGKEYPVSRKTYYELEIGQRVSLHMTSLLRKKVTISRCVDNDCREFPLQGFRDKYTGALLLVLPFIFVVPGLLGWVNISIGRPRLIYIFGCVWAIFTVVIFFGS